MTSGYPASLSRVSYRRSCVQTTTVLAALFACQPSRGTTVPPAPDDAVVTTPGTATIDGARMHALLTELSADDMQGRYTLAPAIERAVELLRGRYQAAGLKPVGNDFRTPYTVVTGAALTRPLELVVRRRGKAVSIAKDAVVARNTGTGGTADAEVVFVGYAMRSRAEGDEPADYDDLAGIDVRGKVALMLTEAPGRPELDELLPALRAHVEAFEARMQPLRQANDTAGMKREQAAVRKALLRVMSPFLHRDASREILTTPPDDPAAALDGATLFDLLQRVRSSEELAGPVFDPRDIRTSRKLQRLVDAGAVGVIVVKGPRTFVDAAAREADRLPELAGERVRDVLAIPVVQMRWHEVERVFGPAGLHLAAVQQQIDEKHAPRSRALAGVTAHLDVALASVTQEAPNVLAQIEGGDLAHEIVLVGAHFDHIGQVGSGHCRGITKPDGTHDDICNGADDNGSGTAAIVEMAQAIQDAGIHPRRTLVFANFSGEEIGLFGSDALSEHPPQVPPFADGKIVAMINLDMIGRLGDKGLAIGGLSSSSAWLPLLGELGDRGMKLVLDRAITSRSDHASFYGQQIPVLFFFTGVHADYHAPGDEIGGIAKDGMVTIAQLACDLVVRLADGTAIPFTPPANDAEGLVGALPGDNPNTLVQLGAPAAAAPH
ncbi:MAG: M20/M25/M40 family metallo-hydrolase [Deltaproteobacteria bacterium]|nr:M20/M25/M40 family metallo-hydrolase [Deltaproteobacteria bacterium]MBK8713506.1 M20/M25/M40 family metallo-hydrolase [Deltaproteobacteria bacterium]MBP7289954.1 M20/M25/M40 family metallo-hydrolase [Nannocystaceae bacterium]